MIFFSYFNISLKMYDVVNADTGVTCIMKEMLKVNIIPRLMLSKYKMLSCSQRPCCRVRRFWPKVEDRNWESLFYAHY